MVGSNSYLQRWVGGALLIVVGIMLWAAPAGATYHQVLAEDWERPVGTPFPWSTGGHPWAVYPTPPTPNRWDIERNSIYHVGAEDAVTSVWCVGGNNQLMAGQDDYPGNVLTYLYWGPFSITGATEAIGSLWLWADMGPYSGSPGDWFYVAVRQGGFTSSITSWDYLYKNEQGGNGMQWSQVSFDFDHITNAAGDTISYLDLNRTSNLLFALVFKSDAANNDHFGVFVDDIGLGYDDGMFDFDYKGYDFFNPDNPDEEFDYLYVNTPAQFRVKFKAHGNLLSNLVNHTLFNANNDPVSTISGQWQGGLLGISYTENFPLIFTPQQEGTLNFTVQLDSDGDQPESNEGNNEGVISIEVYAENTEPSIHWIDPGEDGATTTNQVFDIIFEAFNQPVQETGYVSIYYDYDDHGNDGFTIPGGSGRLIRNAPDTLSWYIGQLGYGDYWLYARMTDGYFDPVYVYSQGPVSFVSGVNEGENPAQPGEFRIVSMYPNPFNPTVDVELELPAPGDIEASWYSVDGRLVDQQKPGRLEAGQQRISWTPQNLPSGVYLLRLTSPFGTITGKATYLK